jgi:hypothetical protein
MGGHSRPELLISNSSEERVVRDCSDSNQQLFARARQQVTPPGHLASSVSSLLGETKKISGARGKSRTVLTDRVASDKAASLLQRLCAESISD